MTGPSLRNSQKPSRYSHRKRQLLRRFYGKTATFSGGSAAFCCCFGYSVDVMPRRHAAPAARKIEKFLSSTAGEHLRIVTGYASWNGLAWLGERTEDRTVDILIGDLSPKRFPVSRGLDAAAEFVFRDDVRIWQPKKRSYRVHAKIWMAGPPMDADVLAGSVNLSDLGLHASVENMYFLAGWERKNAMLVVHETIGDAMSGDMEIQGFAIAAIKSRG